MHEHNIAEYPICSIDVGLEELLSRLESYQSNGLDEELWAWGACIEEVKALKDKVLIRRDDL